MKRTNKKTIYSVMLATIAATAVTALSGSEISFALQDRTVSYQDGIDKTEVTGITTSDITYIPAGFGSSGSDSSSSDSDSIDSSADSIDSSAGSSADSIDSSAGEAGSAILGEGTTPCDAGGSPKVDVRATHIEGILSVAPIWHLFVIYDCSGTEYFYRGGPSEDGETIVGTSGEYTSGTVDWDPDAPSVTVAEGDPALGADDCFQSELSRMENTRTPYKAMGPNSNTVAKTLIANCGFTPEKPVSIAPGWGHPAL